MKTARIKKDVKPHGGRIVSVVREFTHANGRRVVQLVLGRHDLDMRHWTQKFGRLSHTVLEYGPHELLSFEGTEYVFNGAEPSVKERLCRLMTVNDAARLMA